MKKEKMKHQGANYVDFHIKKKSKTKKLNNGFLLTQNYKNLFLWYHNKSTRSEFYSAFPPW